jgi:hypothetical protein
MGSLDCSCVLLNPLRADVGKIATSNTGEDNWYKVGRYTSLHRFPKHGLLDLALLELQALLPRPLLLLPSPLFLSFGRQPVLHAIFSTLPLRGGWW